MSPFRLDHVALYVSDPQRIAHNLLSRLPFRVIEETDEFVLVGRSPQGAKLTFFEAPVPRQPGMLVRIGIGIPCGTASTTFGIGEGLVVELVPTEPDREVDLSHVVLRVPDPLKSVRTWLAFGFERDGTVGHAQRVRLGPMSLLLVPGPAGESPEPLLNHLGLLVESIEETRRSLANLGFDMHRQVDGDNSRAVFVYGPDGVEVEYIEQKPSFALA